MYKFFEEMLFEPKWYHWPLIVFLIPFSFVYMSILHFRFPKKLKDMEIPIVSVGNIILGGSGKTPIVIFLANKFKKYKPAVVLRGYKRKSKGLLVVGKWGKIEEDIEKSGDEALEIAFKTDSLVIVSEDREKGIEKAKELGAGFVILDDGFDKPFKKFNIVIDKKIKNPFTLPAGGYRYPRIALRFADLILKEGKDFKRIVEIPEGDVLVSAISNPKRLLKFWKKDFVFFPDHYDFEWRDVEKLKDKIVVCTMKDYVKLRNFDLDLRVIELKIELKKDILEKIEKYLIKFQKKGK